MLSGEEQRIAIIGVSGAGKSTLAGRMAPLLGLPLIHLDQHCWKPGWEKTPRPEWERVVAELVAQPRWIMDGHFGGTLQSRAAAADAVVFLDLPVWTCLARVFRRWRTYAGRTRPDMTEGCPERWSLDMIHWVVSFPIARRPGVNRILDELPGTKPVIRLTSPAAVDRFVDELRSRRPSTSNEDSR
jgi:adenylate kinase family enzyme